MVGEPVSQLPSFFCQSFEVLSQFSIASSSAEDIQKQIRPSYEVCRLWRFGPFRNCHPAADCCYQRYQGFPELHADSLIVLSFDGMTKSAFRLIHPAKYVVERRRVFGVHST